MTLTIILKHVGLLKVMPSAYILKQKYPRFIFVGTVLITIRSNMPKRRTIRKAHWG
jgi:hypothetical protein